MNTVGAIIPVQKIYEQLIPKVRSDSFVFNERQYWQKLSMAERVIDQIVTALRAYWIDAPADKIWSPVNLTLPSPGNRMAGRKRVR